MRTVVSASTITGTRDNLGHAAVVPQRSTASQGDVVKREGRYASAQIQGDGTLGINRRADCALEPRWNPGTRKVVGAAGFEPATPCAPGSPAAFGGSNPTAVPSS